MDATENSEPAQPLAVPLQRPVRPLTLDDACDQIDAMWRVGVRQEKRIMDLEAQLDEQRERHSADAAILTKLLHAHGPSWLQRHIGGRFSDAVALCERHGWAPKVGA